MISFTKLAKEHAVSYSQSCSECYSQYGKPLFECFDQPWIDRILEESPSDFYGLDIGSCDGIFSDKIQKSAKEKGKKGEIICIDPYPVSETVIGIDTETFISQCNADTYDFIICKFMIHLVSSSFDIFLRNLKRVLRPNGKIYIMTSNSTTSFPWSEKIQTEFVRSCIDDKRLENGLEKDLWIWKKKSYQHRVDCSDEKSQYYFMNFVKHKAISNLHHYSDEELNESNLYFKKCCIETPEKAMIYLNIFLYTLYK